MDKKKRIEVNASSLVGLKAEVLRKQEEFRKEKLERSSTSVKPATSSKNKPDSIWSIKKKQHPGPKIRKDAEELQKERDQMEKSRSMLEVKAKLYEQMTAGNAIPDEETSGLFLVDFEKKQMDKRKESKTNSNPSTISDEEGEDILTPEGEVPAPSNPEEEWVDYTDSLGRSRRCMKTDLPRLIKMDKDLNPDKFRDESVGTRARKDEDATPEMMSSDMHRERMRKKWVEEQEDLVDRGQSSIHYQNVRFDEVRSHGAGYFDFAKDEETRDEQLKTLNYLREETVDKRARREEFKAKRKAALEARLEKVRQRKKIKIGETDGAEQKEDGNKEQVTEGKEEEKAVDPNWQRTLRLVEAVKKESLKEDREWDVHKVPKAWAEQRAKIREERLAEFAPPTEYNPSSSVKRKGKLNKSWKQTNKRFGNIDSQQNEMAYGQAASGQMSFMDADYPPSENTSDTTGRSQTIPAFGNQFEVSREYGDISASNSNIPGSYYESQRLSQNPITSEESSSTDALKNHSAPSISDSKTSDERTGGKGDPGQRSDQEVIDTRQSENLPAPLVRTENSKPIKFSIGFGLKKHDKELPSTRNVLDTEEEIKQTISFFRNQAS